MTEATWRELTKPIIELAISGSVLIDGVGPGKSQNGNIRTYTECLCHNEEELRPSNRPPDSAFCGISSYVLGDPPIRGNLATLRIAP